jgi:hypothetical protein
MKLQGGLVAGGEAILRELLYLLGNGNDRLACLLVCSNPMGKEMMRSEGTAVECILKPISLGAQGYSQAFTQ